MNTEAKPATRVLVVDDQELVRAGFRMILERNGVEVVGEAADGVEAVTAARSSSTPTWFSWTSGCRGWTASRRPAGSSRSGPRCG